MHWPLKELQNQGHESKMIIWQRRNRCAKSKYITHKYSQSYRSKLCRRSKRQFWAEELCYDVWKTRLRYKIVPERPSVRRCKLILLHIEHEMLINTKGRKVKCFCFEYRPQLTSTLPEPGTCWARQPLLSFAVSSPSGRFDTRSTFQQFPALQRRMYIFWYLGFVSKMPIKYR